MKLPRAVRVRQMFRNIVVERVMFFLRFVVPMKFPLQFFLHFRAVVAEGTNEWHFVGETLNLQK